MTSPAFSSVPTSAGIPDFEGSHVASTQTKIVGTVAVAADEDLVVSIDDRVRLVGEYRVVGVQFMVDPKTGDTVRLQILKPIEVQPTPFNPADPKDDGVIRARGPRQP